jgi:organic radical activating enzyme
MSKIIKIQCTKSETYIYWLLTDFCNQRCSYCHSSFHSGKIANSKFFPDITRIDAFIDKLLKIAQSDKERKFFICLSGGEPTTHELFPYIVDRLKTFASVHVITNGTRNISFWETFSKLPDHVIITLHPEYYDSKKLRINELTDFLHNSGVQVRFNLMCYPDLWDKVLEIYDDIDNKFKSFIVCKIIHDFDFVNRPLLEYTQTQLEFIKNNQNKDSDLNRSLIIAHYENGETLPLINANKIMAEEQNYFTGWKCSAGSEIISVNYDGLVFAGICKARYLGTLEKFSFLDEFITCNKISCTCPADICSSKYQV